MDGWVFRSSNDGEENYSDSYGTTRSSSGCLEEFKSDTSFSESFETRSISSSSQQNFVIKSFRILRLVLS